MEDLHCYLVVLPCGKEITVKASGYRCNGEEVTFFINDENGKEMLSGHAVRVNLIYFDKLVVRKGMP